MTYEDLPYSFRKYAESMEWSEEGAIARWKDAEEYREFLVSKILTIYRMHIGIDGLSPTTSIDEILIHARGKRAQLQ